MSTTKGAPFSRSPSSFIVSPFSAASFKISSIVSFDLFMITSSYNSSLNICHTNHTCTLIKSLVVTELRSALVGLFRGFIREVWWIYPQCTGLTLQAPTFNRNPKAAQYKIFVKRTTLDMCNAIKKCVETVYTKNFSLP